LSLFEWHPYTLASGPNEEHLEVMIKALGDHTKELVRRSSKGRNLWIRVDGPYGMWPFKFNMYKAVAMVVGGVGVTPAMSLIRDVFHIQRIKLEAISHLTDVFFIWTCKNEVEFKWYQDMLEEAMKRSADGSGRYPILHSYVHITQPSGDGEDVLPAYVKLGERPDIPTLFENIDSIFPADKSLRIAVVACGPEAMVNATWDETFKRTGFSRRFDFHHETFEF
jgi:respiratory burst oxidase